MVARRRDEKNSLHRLGLTEYESEIVQALIGRGSVPLSYREAMAITGVPYGRIYSVFDSLERKGFLENLGGRPKRYLLRPLGEVLDDYLIVPLIRDTLNAPIGRNNVFRDTWIRQICSSIPVIRVDGGEALLDFLPDLESVRKAQLDEIMHSEREILMCFPTGNFLDRKFSSYVRMSGSVRMEIVSSIHPSELMTYTTEAERETIRAILSNKEVSSKFHFYVNDGVRDRFMVIDERFVAIGSSVSPVLVHIYSTDIALQMKERFQKIRSMSKETPLT
ncbi:MAG: hypothetical protein KIY12_02140 [Thermoplasmata archaeon]|uniref:Transcription regulator TrmB N-terminal domain-containing protein n=1 Tax=Candidatus Sysuiplasma superficiale TaxID=2823368 RepID=A0A8J7YMF5_9ARCH|nr:hypothetical protein [Candidatus Sysuiplasma superficiale]MBX8643518.1 hypothetical protein [Candidatus Sysuiplasma superficiale]